MIGNLFKAAVAVVVAPVAAVVDVVMLIPDATSYDTKRDAPFSRTGAVLGAAGECIKEAIKPERSK